MLLEVETANGRATVDLLSSSYRGDGAPFLVAVDIFDKLGLAAIPRPRTVGEQGDGCPKILYGDTLEKISIHLPPRSLKRFSCTCKHLRLHCSGDDLWRPWLCRLLGSGRSRAKRDGDVKSAGGGGSVKRSPAAKTDSVDDAVSTYLKRWLTPIPIRTIFMERCSARIRVRQAVSEVAKFGGEAHLRPPLTEPEILALEYQYNCILPHSLRELYLACDGEQTGWGPMGGAGGWGMGLANGLRLLPLDEALEARSDQPIRLPPPWRGALAGAGAESCNIVSSERGTALPNDGRDDDRVGDAVPLTSTAGFGSAGETYVCSLSSGCVFKASGLTVTSIGDVSQFLQSLVR